MQGRCRAFSWLGVTGSGGFGLELLTIGHIDEPALAHGPQGLALPVAVIDHELRHLVGIRGKAPLAQALRLGAVEEELVEPGLRDRREGHAEDGERLSIWVYAAADVYLGLQLG